MYMMTGLSLTKLEHKMFSVNLLSCTNGKVLSLGPNWFCQESTISCGALDTNLTQQWYSMSFLAVLGLVCTKTLLGRKERVVRCLYIYGAVTPTIVSHSQTSITTFTGQEPPKKPSDRHIKQPITLKVNVPTITDQHTTNKWIIQ